MRLNLVHDASFQSPHRTCRDYVVEEDFMKAVRKIQETKKLESKLDYGKV